MTTATQKLQTIVATPLADLGIEVSDIELAGGQLRVTVERADGTSIDIDAITEATRIVSDWVRGLFGERPAPRSPARRLTKSAAQRSKSWRKPAPA